MSAIAYYASSILSLLRNVENWYLVFYLILRKKPKVIKLRNGCKFQVRSLMDVWIVKETCIDRDYESNATPIQDGWTVIDIGAGIGEFAILAALECPKSHIYAYEPFPESFALFQENLALNTVKNVRAFQLAIGAESKPMVLSTTGAAVQHTTTHSAASEAAQIEIQGLSLDAAFKANNLTHCDFVKIDCEGCEFEVLFNASPETLNNIDHICLEYHNGFTEFSHLDLVNHLQQNGFRVRVTSNPVHNHLGFLYAYRYLPNPNSTR